MDFSKFHKVRHKLAALVLLTVLGPLQLFAAAQQSEIPEDYLALDHQRCMTPCVARFGEKACKSLCDCTVSEFKKQLSFQEYLDMSVQITRNSVTPELRQLLDNIGKFCSAELDRKGIEIGGEAPSKPEKPNNPDEKP